MDGPPTIEYPPSTCIVCPDIPVPSVAKKVTVDATCSDETFPIGLRSIISSCIFEKLAIPPLDDMVGIGPALTAFTLIFCDPISSAKPLTTASKLALAGPMTLYPGMARVAPKYESAVILLVLVVVSKSGWVARAIESKEYAEMS